MCVRPRYGTGFPGEETLLARRWTLALRLLATDGVASPAFADLLAAVCGLGPLRGTTPTQNTGCEAEDGCLGWLQVPRRVVTAEEPTAPTVDSPALLMTRAGTHPAHLSEQTVCGLPTVLGTRAPCTAAS